MPGNLQADHPGPAILSEHFKPFAPEKGMGDVSVELGTMREVLIEVPNQSLARKRQVNLFFTIPRLFVRSMLPKALVERVLYFRPPGMAGQSPFESRFATLA